jgi:hypothetical protein
MMTNVCHFQCNDREYGTPPVFIEVPALATEHGIEWKIYNLTFSPAAHHGTFEASKTFHHQTKTHYI